jgi:hypothetical protein
MIGINTSAPSGHTGRRQAAASSAARLRLPAMGAATAGAGIQLVSL